MKTLLTILILISFFSCRKDVNHCVNPPKFYIYPNPFSNDFNIESHVCVPFHLIIYNKVGEMVLEETKLKSGIKNINLSKFDSGIYVIHIKSKDFTSVQKVLKQ